MELHTKDTRVLGWLHNLGSNQVSALMGCESGQVTSSVFFQVPKSYNDCDSNRDSSER